MNYTKDIGWYYINGNNKSPSWTGGEYTFQKVRFIQIEGVRE